MNKILFLTFLISSHAYSFILVDKNYRLSKPDETKVMISSEGCGANVTDGELKSAIEKSVDMWNDVPEAHLFLKYGGKSATSITSSTISSGQVIVGCEVLPAGAAAGTVHDRGNGSAKISFNSTNFTPGSYTADGLAGVLIHELGHAIGLTHSKDPASVMTYEANGWSPMPSYLAQDDVDGVVYLYPNEKKIGGLLGSCDSLAEEGASSKDRAGVWLNIISGFLLAFVMLFFLKLTKKLFSRN